MAWEPHSTACLVAWPAREAEQLSDAGHSLHVHSLYSCAARHWRGFSLQLVAGIPKFYRWLSERYPLINVSTAAVTVPIIDNLYFDMNGIIHNCTHGNDPSRKPTETEMVLKIFDYLDKLVHIVQPQQLLFMAIDGARVCSASCALRRMQHASQSTAARRLCPSSQDEPAAREALQVRPGPRAGACPA